MRLYYRETEHRLKIFRGTPAAELLVQIREQLGIAASQRLAFTDEEGDVVLFSSFLPDGQQLFVATAEGSSGGTGGGTSGQASRDAVAARRTRKEDGEEEEKGESGSPASKRQKTSAAAGAQSSSAAPGQVGWLGRLVRSAGSMVGVGGAQSCSVAAAGSSVGFGVSSAGASAAPVVSSSAEWRRFAVCSRGRISNGGLHWQCDDTFEKDRHVVSPPLPPQGRHYFAITFSNTYCCSSAGFIKASHPDSEWESRCGIFNDGDDGRNRKFAYSTMLPLMGLRGMWTPVRVDGPGGGTSTRMLMTTPFNHRTDGIYLSTPYTMGCVVDMGRKTAYFFPHEDYVAGKLTASRMFGLRGLPQGERVKFAIQVPKHGLEATWMAQTGAAVESDSAFDSCKVWER